MGVEAIAMTAAPAQAILVDNGSTTIDTVAGLEWLDVTETQGQSFNSIVGGFGGFAGQGYVHATRSQLCGLMAALGDPLSNCFIGNGANDVTFDVLAPSTVSTLSTLLGGSTLIQTPLDATVGYFASDFPASGDIGLACLNIGSSACGTAGPTLFSFETNQNGSFSHDSSDPRFGNFLVRDVVVPEPGTLAIFGLELIGLGVARRKAVTSTGCIQA